MNNSWRRRMILAVTALMSSPLSAIAQQNLPRPIVLYRPPTSATQPRATPSTNPVNGSQRVVNSSQSAGFNNSAQRMPMAANQFTGGSTVGPNGRVNQAQQPNGVQPVSQTTATDPSDPRNAHNSESQTSEAKELAARQALPTNQVIQNPSGLYNMTHAGMTSQQQYAPNLYFGPQFRTWSNQQSPSDAPASYGEMSRFQVGQFGGYIAPNTYMGSGFNNWNNLNSGSSTPSANGGWTYSTWP